MIEIKIYPGEDTIYINFKYQGIPEDLPIERIEIRNKPSNAVSEELKAEETERQAEKLAELEEEQELMPTKNIVLEAPVKNVKAQLKEIILKADQIQFGNEDFGTVIQYVNVNSQ